MADSPCRTILIERPQLTLARDNGIFEEKSLCEMMRQALDWAKIDATAWHDEAKLAIRCATPGSPRPQNCAMLKKAKTTCCISCGHCCVRVVVDNCAFFFKRLCISLVVLTSLETQNPKAPRKHRVVPRGAPVRKEHGACHLTSAHAFKAS